MVNGKLKKDWVIKNLAEICEILNGGTPDTTVKKFWDGDNLWITPKDMGKMKGIYVDDTLRKITDEGLKNSSAKILPVNSIILSSRAPIGHLAINTKPISTNQGCRGLVPKKGISTLYVYYFLSMSVDLLNSLGTGATFKELSSSKLGAVEIPLPPLTEQQRIVATLDKAFAAIAKAKANAEQNLKNAKELFESYLQSVFADKGKDWEDKVLTELCEQNRIITYGVIKLGDEVQSGVPCLRTSNVRWLRIDTSGMKRIAPKLSSEYSRTILKGGEVLVNVRGTLGGVAVATPEMKGWNISREVAVVPIDPAKINPFFLSYLIGSGSSQQWLGAMKKGAAYVGINIEDLRQLPVSAPSLNKQLEIIQSIQAMQEKTQKLEAIYQQKINDLEELKKSILQKAFNGELP